jgi:hypothetical protein
MGPRRWRGRQALLYIFVVALVAVTLTGCFRRSLLPFLLEFPPAVLVPAGLAGVADGRARFREVWCAVRADHGKDLPEDRPCEEVLLRLAGEGAPSGLPVALASASGALRVAVVPGSYGECLRHLAEVFSDGLAHLVTHGYRTEAIQVSGRSSSQHNAAQIRDAVLGMTLAPGERLLLIGYSKGSVDILEALARYPEIAPHVAATVSVAGAINGSPLADGLRDFYVVLAEKLPLRRCEETDGGLFASLRRSERLAFLASATLPASVRYFSLAGFANRADTSRLLEPTRRRLALLDPRNDGQLLWTDTIIPGATLLGYVRADHWAIAMPFSRTSTALAATLIDRNAFPREVLLEAVVRTVEESLKIHRPRTL